MEDEDELEEADRDGETDALRLRRPLSLSFDGLLGGIRVEEAEGRFLRRSSSPQLDIRTSVIGQSSLSTATFPNAWRIAWPETTCPKTECLPLRCGHGARVMKNL